MSEKYGSCHKEWNRGGTKGISDFTVKLLSPMQETENVHKAPKHLQK